MAPIRQKKKRPDDPEGFDIFGAIEAFQRAVDAQLPDMYAWLSPESYHMTLRAIH